MDIPQLQKLINSLRPFREALLSHPIYTQIETIEDFQLFMQFHVFAVWDFMSNLKSLQRQLTCVQIPWIPAGSPVTRRLINEIVLEEESDDDGQGGYRSHFELYLEAMKQAGANVLPVTRFIESLMKGSSFENAIESTDIAPSIKTFLGCNWKNLQTKNLAKIAASFTFGREDIIPDMFRNIVVKIDQKHPQTLSLFSYYLNRHIELDSDQHFPMAEKMLIEICGEDSQKWQQAQLAAQQALKGRQILWDGLYKELVNAKNCQQQIA